MPARTRTLKLFCDPAEQKRLGDRYETVERYPSFVLLRVTPGQARTLARRFPVEDITRQYALRVDGRSLDTRRARIGPDGRTLPHPAYRGVKRLPPGEHHYLVQFVGPIKKAWLARLRRIGAEPRAPFADFTYVVRCDSRHLARIASLPMVRWMGHLPHSARIDMEPAEKALPRTRVLEGVVRIEFFDAGDLRRGAARVRRLGLRVLSSDAASRVLTVEIAASGPARAAQIAQLSAVHGVRAIRRRTLKRTSNDVAPGLMNAQLALSDAVGLSGRGEVVAVCDTGLDTGDPRTIHRDFRGRVAAIRSYPITPDLTSYVRNPGADDGPADLDSGHGTHVAGSVLGSGAASRTIDGQTEPIRGFAYRARLVFQAVEQEIRWKSWDDELESGRFVLMIPDDLGSLFRYAYEKGARIHSNSWGGGDAGQYDAQCRQLDEFVWRHPDFCVVVAAGNDGTDKDGDGRINPMSVTSPATAKNCITVGASESRRRQFDAETYGGWWAEDYPRNPIHDDPMADDPHQVVAFSSRGPTRDGRTKPDVVAPGTFVLSVRSRKIAENNTGWSAFPPSGDYFYMGGTSMATPLVAGATALLRESLRRRGGYRSPSAALLKAALIAGARKLSGESPPTRPADDAQGYGLVDLDAIVAPERPAEVYFVDETDGLETGGAHEFDLEVHSRRAPLRVVLAYSDFPGPALVNNLNLVLVDPRGRSHVGNGTRAGSLELDSSNNVEVVHVKRPQPGRWRVQVVGSNVPQGPQDYALCLRGHITT
jgi:subtilisin family serine protease